MLSRPHPAAGWLYLHPSDWRRSLNRSLVERDKQNDPQWVGHSPEYLRWVWNTELPELMKEDRYRVQLVEHLQRLTRDLARVMAAINDGHQYREPEAQQLRGQVAQLEVLLNG